MIFPPGDIWQYPETLLSQLVMRCYWHLVGYCGLNMSPQNPHVHICLSYVFGGGAFGGNVVMNPCEKISALMRIATV